MFHRLRGDVRAFWDQVQPDDPRLVNNPIAGRASWKDRAVPMSLHGDGASFTMKDNKLLAISCNFLLAAGWSWRSTFLLGVFTGINRTFGSLHGGLENDTWHVIWLHIVHAFQALFAGVHPLLDPFEKEWPLGSRPRELAGQDICGGEFFLSCVGFWRTIRNTDRTS